MRGHPRRPPPPYSQSPLENNVPNDDYGSIQTDISNERSPLLASPPTIVHHIMTIVVPPGLKSILPMLPLILIPGMTFIMIFIYSQIGVYREFYEVVRESFPRFILAIKERDSRRHEAGVAWSSPVKGSCVRYALRKYSSFLCFQL